MSLLLTNTQGKAFVVNANDMTVPYQRVEYLESTGDGEYIQTPIKTVRDSRFVIDAEFVSTSVNYYYILGDKIGTSVYRVVLGIGKSRNQYYSQCGNGTGYVYFGTVNTSRHVFDIQNGAQSGQTILLDDTQYTSSYALSSDSQTGLSLFGYNTSVGAIKIYELKVYESNVLVLDYVPVRVGSVGYMHDKVSGQLFGNSGTGDFVIGPDMPSKALVVERGPEYVADGIIHLI